jgi:hypothetical protein
MRVITVRNVSEALLLGLHTVRDEGILRDSRNGPVRVFRTPVTTVYKKPKERVMFFPERDANPFFHFMEGLWMIAGRNDVEWISRFNGSIANYSDDGVTFHGAYGHRWREWFGVDQLATCAMLLKENPDDRRVSMGMWDPASDLGREGKDFPCNQMVNFRIVDGRLDMYVFNRSNDMIWGAYGANAVHFSMMQEVVAAWIGVEVGIYEQISTNFHAYMSTFEKHSSLLSLPIASAEYESGEVSPYPMVNGPIEDWMADLEMFVQHGEVIGYRDKFFKRVALPMLRAWNWHKAKDHEMALKAIGECAATDWQKACREYIIRRIK